MAAAMGGTLMAGSPDQTFAGIGTDSRTIEGDECFVALVGDVHDGHTFLSDVLHKGIQGVIVRRERAEEFERRLTAMPQVVCIAVDDTLAALGALAAYHRRNASVSVAAITGSNGKTSTRSMATQVLAQRFNVLSPHGNFNNEIGLPLTLLRLTPSHRWAVLELGMNHPGEISRLGDICRPDIGLITNIGPAHLEGLGTIEGVMHAKGELLEKIRPGGTVILNADDPMTAHLRRKTSAEPLLFGLSEAADIRGFDIAAHPVGIGFTLAVAGEKTDIHLASPGEFMVANALAAASIGHTVGLSLAEIKSGLENFSPIHGRMNLHRLPGGITVIDDTYNANPNSVKAAISTLQALKGQHRAILVLGDMLELGDASRSLHGGVGSFAARTGVSRLYATGEFADAVSQGARLEGMPEKSIFCGSKADIFKDLIERLTAGDWLLVKGSRGMRMETLVKDILNELSEGRP